MTITIRSLTGDLNSITQSRSRIGRSVLGATLVVVFVALEWLSSIHEFMSVPITPWNPGLGVVFAFMLLRGPVYGLVLFAGMIAAELFVVRTELQWPLIVAIAGIISIVYGSAAVLIRRALHLDAGLYHLRDLMVLLTGGIAAAVFTSALVALVLLLDDRIELDNILTAATPLLLGDIIGIAVMTPLTLRLVMLIQGRASLSGYSRPLAIEVALYAALASVALFVIVGGPSGTGLRYFYLRVRSGRARCGAPWLRRRLRRACDHAIRAGRTDALFRLRRTSLHRHADADAGLDRHRTCRRRRCQRTAECRCAATRCGGASAGEGNGIRSRRALQSRQRHGIGAGARDQSADDGRTRGGALRPASDRQPDTRPAAGQRQHRQCHCPDRSCERR